MSSMLKSRRALFITLLVGLGVLDATSLAQTCDQQYAANCVLWLRYCRGITLPGLANTAAEKRSYINDLTPSIGAVAVIDITTGVYADNDHVAAIEAIHPDGTITIREANWLQDPPRVGSRRQTPAQLRVVGYFNPTRPSLALIKKNGTGSGRAEVHILSGAAHFTQFSLNTSTAQAMTTDAEQTFRLADWDGDGRSDLIGVKKFNTGLRAMEVHVLAAAGGFQRFSLNTGTPEAEMPNDNYEIEFGDWNGDRRADLFLIKKFGTGTRRSEVHILSGAQNYQAYLLHTGTPHAETGDNFEFEVGDIDRDARPDLVMIKKSGTASGRTEVHVLSGASTFQRYVLNVATALPQTDREFTFAVGDWNRDGRPDLLGLKRFYTGTNGLEVHVLSGATHFSTFILQTGTPHHEIRSGYDFDVIDW